MFTKLDSCVVKILCCPQCKGVIKKTMQMFICTDCGIKYPRCSIKQGKDKDYAFDFRLHRPVYCIPETILKWVNIQKEYEKYHKNQKSADDLIKYSNRADSVKEIYTREFELKGKILDVGGGQGILRQDLKDAEVPLYVSIDPHFEAFQDLESQQNLLRSYPCLLKPCNFLLSYAENLPFAKKSFDWVHMRSVLDHFYDPYIALKEAYRVLKDEGTLLIGLEVYGGKSLLKTDNSYSNISHPVSVIANVAKKFKKKGLIGFASTTVRRVMKGNLERKPTNHTFHWRHENIIDLMLKTKFKIIKEHWQKSPFEKCVYLSAKKMC